jgi:ADP-ribose pyrophosphatase YjhB (NUDIX family)
VIKYNFCPQCKTKTDNSGEYPKCPNCKVVFYKNSKPTAGVLPVKDGKVLLGRRAEDPHKGQLDIIGGFLNWKEHPINGAVREAKEETGLNVEIVDLLGIYMDVYEPTGDATQNTYFIGKVTGGKLKAEDDVESLHWLEIEKLPNDLGSFKHLPEVIKDLKKWYKKNENN